MADDTRDDVRIGVLGLQGDYAAHQKMLEDRLKVDTQVVRSPDELEHVDALILPGGESTTVGKLIERHGLDEPLKRRAAEGMPLYGTCAGLILLARDVEGSDQYRLGVLDATVARNAFGRQVDSFEADIEIPAIGEPPVRGVFIRAPSVTRTGEGVEVLGRFEERIVAVRQGRILASAFHPELTDDSRFHEYFVRMVRESRRQDVGCTGE